MQGIDNFRRFYVIVLEPVLHFQRDPFMDIIPRHFAIIQGCQMKLLLILKSVLQTRTLPLCYYSSANLNFVLFHNSERYLHSIFSKKMSSNSSTNQSCLLKRNDAYCAPGEDGKFSGQITSINTFHRKVQMISNGKVEYKVNTSNFM